MQQIKYKHWDLLHIYQQYMIENFHYTLVRKIIDTNFSEIQIQRNICIAYPIYQFIIMWREFSTVFISRKGSMELKKKYISINKLVVANSNLYCSWMSKVWISIDVIKTGYFRVKSGQFRWESFFNGIQLLLLFGGILYICFYVSVRIYVCVNLLEYGLLCYIPINRKGSKNII